jgi:hypothetical protein
MGDIDKKKADNKQEPQSKVEDKMKKPPPPLEEEEDDEGGDIVSPRCDPSDTDDEPL